MNLFYTLGNLPSSLIQFEFITLCSEIFARLLFSRITIKDIFATLKVCLGHDLPTSVNNIVISRGFYFHETSHRRSFAKIKPS